MRIYPKEMIRYTQRFMYKYIHCGFSQKDKKLETT